MKVSTVMFLGWLAAFCVCLFHFVFSRNLWRKSEFPSADVDKEKLRELYVEYREDNPGMWDSLMEEDEKISVNAYNFRELFHHLWGVAKKTHGHVSEKWGACGDYVDKRTLCT